MVKIEIEYNGALRCAAKHAPSSASIHTDAPVDNHGLGESFSPTDLVATGLGTCLATIMGIVANRKELDLNGLAIEVEKEMTAQPPRRIARLAVSISMPIAEDHEHAELLKSSALACPVHQSLHPEIEIPIVWNWQS